MEARSVPSGEVYRDEAAELMAAAARAEAGSRKERKPVTGRQAPPLVVPESRRPLPYPEPSGVNDNADDPEYFERPRRRLSIPRVLARVFIAPLYLVVAAGTLGIIGLFVKSFIGI